MHHEQQQSNKKLALQATLHCLMGCGIGDILGVIIGTFLGLPYIGIIITGVVFGYIFGFLFSVLPLLKAGMTLVAAAKIILSTETLSILTMEAAETVTEISFFPGMRMAGVAHVRYWFGLLIALIAGFVVAYPVNYLLVKRGVRHHH
jgi:prepilin signal peptidase PulO-like enzyme (type II secretory pathway)